MIFILSLTSPVSAEIMLFQPSNSYSFGDSINVSATIKENFEKSGFFYLYLKCGETINNNFHMEYIALASNEEKLIQPSSIPVTKAFFDDAKECKITASFLDEASETNSFLISEKIIVSILLQNATLNPEDSFTLSGTAVKENGKNVEGFIELRGEDLNINLIRKVENGEIKANFTITENAKQGMHVLFASVYERDKEGNPTNKESFQINLNINQKPRKIDTALESESFPPGSVMKFKPIIYDQAGDIVIGDIHIKLYNPYRNLAYEDVMKSNEEKSLEFSNNATPGFWEIYSSSAGLEGKRIFSIEKLEKASFSLANSTLTITNVGNVLYNKLVRIQIGNATKIIENPGIEIGKSKDYVLKAEAEGLYDVSVSDGTEIKQGKVSLAGSITGRAVEVSEFGERSFSDIIPRYPIVWFFLLFIFAVFMIVMIERFGGKKGFSYSADKKSIAQTKIISAKDFIASVSDNPNLKKAEYSLVLSGAQAEASLLALKIKNISEIGKYEKELLVKIEEHINDNKGMIYKKDDFIVGLFFPQITKTFKNEIKAVRVAKEIEKQIKEHNRKFKSQIDFGLSVNSGQIVTKREADIFKFTSLLNTLPMAKKLAELSQKELLISDNTYKKIMPDVKARKESVSGINAYKVDELKEKEQYKQFINSFMQRQKTDSKAYQNPNWIKQPEDKSKNTPQEDKDSRFDFLN